MFQHNTDIDPRIRYILEETTSVPVLDKHPVFIVYPFETAEPFELALELLKDLELIPQQKVIWMETPIDGSNFQPHLTKPDNMKWLFQKEEKHLYFIMCPHQQYYTIKHLKVLLNMIATAITDCAELVNQEGNKEELTAARGPWHITLVIADTLQAYNDEDYVNNEKTIKEELRNSGSELIEEAKRFILSDEFIGNFAVKKSIDDLPEHKNLKLTAGKDISVIVNIMNWEKHRSLNNKYAENYALFCDLYRNKLCPKFEKLSKKIDSLKKEVDKFRESVNLQKKKYAERLKKKIDLVGEADKLHSSVDDQKKKYDESEKKQAKKSAELLPRNTRRFGDCAFHAVFGKWDGKEFVCDDVVNKRKKLADSIRECKTHPILLNLVKEAIKALIMEGKLTKSPIIKNAQEEYRNYLQSDPKRMELAWNKFDKTLQKYTDITDFIKDFCKEHCANKSISLQSLTNISRFQTCLNESSDDLKGKILSIPELDNAFIQYNNECSAGFNWEVIYSNPDLINDYANFIETLGNWLIPVELQIISHVFAATIVYHVKDPAAPNSNSRMIDTYNPGKPHIVSICFNGNNHYEKMTNQDQLITTNEHNLKEGQKINEHTSNQWVFYNNFVDDKLNSRQRLLFVKSCILGLNPDYTTNSPLKKIIRRTHEVFLFNLLEFDETTHVMRDEIKEVENKLATKPNAKDPTLIIVCHGQGGVGKTHLTSYYLNSSGPDYTLRIRIRAGTPNELRRDINRLAENLKMSRLGQDLQLFNNFVKKNRDEEIRKALLNWLERNAGWLLVFDDVVDYEMVKNYIPRCGGHVLISSRISTWDKSVAHRIPLDVMKDKEPIELLQKYSGRNDSDFETLAKKLGNFPLALNLVAIYFKENKEITVTQFCEEYDKNPLVMLVNNEVDCSTLKKHPVAYTVELSIGRILGSYHDKKKAVDPDFIKQIDPKIRELILRELLYTCAYFSHNNISLEMLNLCLTASLNKIYSFETLKVEPIKILKEFCEQLDKYALIKYHRETNLIDIHTLIQDIQRNVHKMKITRFNSNQLADDSDFSTWLEMLTMGFCKSVPEKKQYLLEQLTLYWDLLPHAEALKRHHELEAKTNGRSGYIGMSSHMLNKMLAFLQVCSGMVVEPNGLYQEVLRIERGLQAKGVMGGNIELDILQTLVYLAHSEGQLGNNEKASAYLDEALTISKKTNIENHSDTIDILKIMAQIFGCLNRLELKRNLLMQVLKLSSYDYPDVALILKEIDEINKELNIQKDERFTGQTLELIKKRYGLVDAKTAKRMYRAELAHKNFFEGRENCKVLENMLLSHEKRNDANNATKILILAELAEEYRLLEDYTKECKTLHKYLDICGPQHTDRPKIIHCLANATGNVGDNKEKCKLLEGLLKDYGEKYDEYDKALRDLGIAYGKQGDLKKQKEYMEKALVAAKKRYGEEHKIVKEAIYNLNLANKKLLEKPQNQEANNTAKRSSDESSGNGMEIFRGMFNKTNTSSSPQDPKMTNKIIIEKPQVQEANNTAKKSGDESSGNGMEMFRGMFNKTNTSSSPQDPKIANKKIIEKPQVQVANNTAKKSGDESSGNGMEMFRGIFSKNNTSSSPQDPKIANKKIIEKPQAQETNDSAKKNVDKSSGEGMEMFRGMFNKTNKSC